MKGRNPPMPTVDVKRLGETLRRHRIAACLSQEEVALKAGMSQKKYSTIEQGYVQDPGIGDIVEIGRVLRFTPNDLAEVAGLWAPMQAGPSQGLALGVRADVRQPGGYGY
jgi:DNA-binding XRE family transcriptional regulator